MRAIAILASSLVGAAASAQPATVWITSTSEPLLVTLRPSDAPRAPALKTDCPTPCLATVAPGDYELAARARDADGPFVVRATIDAPGDLWIRPRRPTWIGGGAASIVAGVASLFLGAGLAMYGLGEEHPICFGLGQPGGCAPRDGTAEIVGGVATIVVGLVSIVGGAMLVTDGRAYARLVPRAAVASSKPAAP